MCDRPFGETSGQVKIRILKFMGATKFAVHFSGPISSQKSPKIKIKKKQKTQLKKSGNKVLIRP